MGCGSSVAAHDKNPLKDNDDLKGSIHSRRFDENIEHIELSDDIVDQYVLLEQEIHRYESKGVIQKHEEKIREADNTKKTVDQLEATCKEIKKQTDKKKTDVENLEQPSVKTFLRQQGTYDEKLAKEQKDFQESLAKQEIAEKELKENKSQYERALKIAEIYKRRVDKLNETYDKEDQLLAGIYGGQYGSELENKLEHDLDVALEWQQRVSLARFKWTNGRVLLVHACTQMAFGVKRWQELDTIEISNTRARYFAAAEARNNFVAASQNVQSCRVYLGKVQFPYCTEDEMMQLDRAINNAFVDIQAADRYKLSLELYQTIHRQVASLIQWFDQVINETIIKDYQKSLDDVALLQRDLRGERYRLMKESARAKLNRDVVIDYDHNVQDFDDEEVELRALEAEKAKQQNQQNQSGGLENLLTMTQPTGNALPVGKLAPIPSNETLFGNVKTIRQQHDQERRELEKLQEATRARMDLSLEEKLRQRRTRGGRRKTLGQIDASGIKPQ